MKLGFSFRATFGQWSLLFSIYFILTEYVSIISILCLLRKLKYFPGASFIVVKGLKDARKCSYLGELDSQEESDEISDEFEFAHHIEEDVNASQSVPFSGLPFPSSGSSHG